MRRLWDYIKKHRLQDDLLRPLFDGNDQLSMFEMTSYVSRHLHR
jgi:chromatin remodeling complex protein RSC6